MSQKGAGQKIEWRSLVEECSIWGKNMVENQNWHYRERR
jgi:hypothetical protein